MNKKTITATEEKAVAQMRLMGATIRTSQAIQHGIHPRTLYKLRDDGILEQITRGVFRFSDSPAISDPDLITVALRVPNGVICLISALSFHHITTQIPRSISIAIKTDSRIPKIDWPPISVHKFSSKSFSNGIEEHKIDDITVKVYSIEKTLADCFKYRNKIGMDIVLEAFKYYKERKKIRISEIIKYAEICRVEKSMMPYLEAML